MSADFFLPPYVAQIRVELCPGITRRGELTRIVASIVIVGSLQEPQILSVLSAARNGGQLTVTRGCYSPRSVRVA